MDRPSDDVVFDLGAWLVEHRLDLDRGEAQWLMRLAEFDRDGLWALDGQLSCATWLVWRTNMARSTAFEKLRVAHELLGRPVLTEAFARGRLSYSMVRAMTRMDHPSPEVDEALVALAESGQASVLDIERVVRSFNLYADQERPPAPDRELVRDVKIRRSDGEGIGQILVTLSDLEIEEFAAALQAFIDLRYRLPGMGEKSPAEDSGSEAGREAPLEEAGRAARKADAFVDLVATALAGAGSGHAAGDDRYMVHVVTRDSGRSFTLPDGTPLPPTDTAMIACDASRVAHLLARGGEPLDLGRKTREWTTAQRRAVTIRDGGHCRFPGCQYRHYDIHHLRAWDDGGPTDIGNGVCECRRHHRMLHSGYHTQGDPAGELRFYRPGGTCIGSTYPAAARVLVGVGEG